MTHDADWGESLILSASTWLDRHGDHLVSVLPEAAIGDLYEWMVVRFPASEDPEDHTGEMHRISARESAGYFRDALIRTLAHKGTSNAVAVIHKLIKRFPSAGYLRWLAVSARQVTLERTWEPPAPAQIIRLLRHPDLRLLQNADQLLDLVIESIRRWEAKLQGVPPAAFQLWEQSPYNRPKGEERVSDAVALHLKDDLQGRGIAINREVQIRPAMKGGAKGERTDIQVDATVVEGDDSSHPVISITVEVKGCWNKDLLSALNDQLAARYLADSSTTHGLYLVSRCACAAWNDPNDSRRERVPATNIKDLETLLELQAAKISTDGLRIRAIVINATLR